MVPNVVTVLSHCISRCHLHVLKFNYKYRVNHLSSFGLSLWTKSNMLKSNKKGDNYKTGFYSYMKLWFFITVFLLVHISVFQVNTLNRF